MIDLKKAREICARFHWVESDTYFREALDEIESLRKRLELAEKVCDAADKAQRRYLEAAGDWYDEMLDDTLYEWRKGAAE